jgi:8-oxo-dGTP diphosphatase
LVDDTHWVAYQRAIVAVYLLIERDGQLLLAQRANTGFADGCWSLPAGHVDDGESVSQAMSREACEELGLMIDPQQLTLAMIMHRKLSESQLRCDWFFRCDARDERPINREPEKCAALGWFSPTDLPEPMLDYVAEALTAIERGQQWLEFGWE